MKRLYILTLCVFASLFSFAQQNMELIGELSYSDELSDIWGYVDGDGTEYALVGVVGTTGQTGGVSVVSLADPANPVEVYFSSGTNSIWRDIKVYNGYAYVTTEADDGLHIINLNSLPDASGIEDFVFWGENWTSAHNLYIDESGILYIFGANRGNGGVIMYDLNADPVSPEEVGDYEAAYVHDGMARGDTLYTGNIYAGTFSVVDVTDKTDPIYLGGAETPSSFCHNVWVSDDGNYVYTTDEVSNAFIAGYNISDLGDVEETDRIQFDPGSNTIVHNAHVSNNYVITSYYKAGVTVHDVSDPYNIIQTGHYDTSPLSGGGYGGAWGVYPFFPSGNLVVSDIEEGLFVIGSTYTRASRLEGQITDGPTGDPIFDASIEILDTGVEAIDNSDVSGMYKTGMAEEGFFDVLVVKAGYDDVLVEGVAFTNGEVTILDVVMGDVSNSIETNALWNGVSISPNPVQNEFKLMIPNELQLENVQLIIADISGKVVYNETLNSNSEAYYVNANLENGLYLVSLSSTDRVLYKNKIIVSK